MGKILIVEDSTTDMAFVADVMKNADYEIVTAIDGEEAELKIATEEIDLMILDIVIPKKNGFQVCRNSKGDERFRHIPVIMLSSKGNESDKVWGLKQGADEYLTKPVEPLDLLLIVKKHLQRRGTSEAGTNP